MPTIDLTDDKHAAITAAILRLIDEDRLPHAPRLDSLRFARPRAKAKPRPTPAEHTAANSRRKACEALGLAVFFHHR